MQIPISVLPLLLFLLLLLLLPPSGTAVAPSVACIFPWLLLSPLSCACVVHLVSITLSSPSTLLVPLLLFVIRCEFSVPYLSRRAFCTRHRRVLGTSTNSYNGDKLYRAAINLRNAINIPSVRCLYIPIPIRCLWVCVTLLRTTITEPS